MPGQLHWRPQLTRMTPWENGGRHTVRPPPGATTHSAGWLQAEVRLGRPLVLQPLDTPDLSHSSELDLSSNQRLGSSQPLRKRVQGFDRKHAEKICSRALFSCFKMMLLAQGENIFFLKQNKNQSLLKSCHLETLSKIQVL